MSDGETEPRGRSFIGLYLRIAVSVTLVGLLLSRVEWPEIREIGDSLRPIWLLPILGGMLVVTILSTVKWNIFLRADDIRLPFPSLLSSYLIAAFFSCFLPSNIGGDVYRVYAVGREASKSKALAAVMMGRLTGFFVLAAIGLAAALISIDRIGDPRVVWGIGGALFAIVSCFLLVCSRRLLALGQAVLERLRLERVGRVAERVQGSILRYRSRPSVIGGSLLVSLFQQVMLLITIGLISRLVGLDIAPIYFFAFIPVIEATAAIPISIFGLGVRDAGYVFLFATVGVSDVQSLSMSLMYVTLSLVYASVGGLLYLLRSSSGQAQPAPE